MFPLWFIFAGRSFLPLATCLVAVVRSQTKKVHHAFPNAVGTLSQRGRFHGWEKVHDAAAEVLHRGLWKPNGDEDRIRKSWGALVHYAFHSFFAAPTSMQLYGIVILKTPSRHEPFGFLRIYHTPTWTLRLHQETQMQKTQRKRSLMMKQGK